jgi:hypothetical protein
MKATLSLLAMAFAYASATTCNYIEISETYFPTDACYGYETSSYNESYMYTCMMNMTSNMYYVNYSSFDSFDCTGTIDYTYNIMSGDTGYEFLCGQDDCSVVYEYDVYDSTDDCTGTPYTRSQYPVVAGICNNDSTSYSYVYGCTDDSYTMYTYSDSMCKTLSTKTKYSKECIGSSLTTTSVLYKVATCGMPGYYGIASSQIPAFSTLISFVMIAVAFFAC